MGGPDLFELLDGWRTSGAEPVTHRLAALLGLAPAELARDTLGQRNRRLIALLEAWVDRPVEAHVVCPACSASNEFILPLAAMKDLPEPLPGARVDYAGRTFRLPTMADIEALGPDPLALARRCADDPALELEPHDLAVLGASFDELDPLARLEIDSDCSICGQPISADVVLEDFVAAELTRTADLLLRDIDVIAAAYGWSEEAIAALPAARRARYVALIAGRRGPRSLEQEGVL